MCMSRLPTATGEGTDELLTATPFETLVGGGLRVVISKMLALTPDWLAAILGNKVVTLALTAAHATRDEDGPGIRQGLKVSLVLDVPKC